MGAGSNGRSGDSRSSSRGGRKRSAAKSSSVNGKRASSSLASSVGIVASKSLKFTINSDFAAGRDVPKRILDGITAGNLSLAQAYISDVTAAKDRAKSFAIIGIAFGLGFLVGPAVSGYLSQFGYSTPIWAAAGLSALSIICTSTGPKTCE